MVKPIFTVACLLAITASGISNAMVPDSGVYQGQYHITMRAAPLGNVLGFGVSKPEWRWDFDNDTATVSGTTLSVGFNYALHDINNANPDEDVLHFTRNSDGTITLHYALQIYHPGLGNPMANTTTRFSVEAEGATLKIETLDWETNGPDDIVGTQIPNVFPLTIEQDLSGSAVQVGIDSNLDGINDQQALALGLNPDSFDSDDDGITDWDEIGGDLSTPLDSDNDSIIDALEYGDTAYSAHQVYGLKTQNKQTLNIETSSELEVGYATISSMQRPVSAPDSSDGFAELDSTLGQPGLTYSWGNLSLEFDKTSALTSKQTVSLNFSHSLPDKLVVYAFNEDSANNYQLVNAQNIRRPNPKTVVVTLSEHSPWLATNGSGERYQITLAIAENTLGDKQVKERKVSSAGGSGVIYMLLLIFTLVFRLSRKQS
ncbi:hypothetical protein [Vibrio mediterranei]|uniref:hypothetical protein n=1 Tax=Vibrio mediterranei TaxID=689 RepID=UPI001EFE7B6B|nr:hypothetical protein [Vibrio mediterranei]MCG9657975.1 hypothetical protein [Vibrio mediterranei]